MNYNLKLREYVIKKSEKFNDGDLYKNEEKCCRSQKTFSLKVYTSDHRKSFFKIPWVSKGCALSH